MMRRIFYCAIVLFWLGMWTLLIRREYFPQDTRFSDVPINYLERILFKHEQISDLAIMANGSRVGHLQIAPQIRNKDGARILRVTGDAQIRILDARTQRWLWTFIMESDAKLEPTAFFFTLIVRETGVRQSEGIHLWIDIHPKDRIASYTLKEDNVLVKEQTFPLSEAGISTLMAEMGMDAALLPSFTSVASSEIPTFRAQHTRLDIRGDEVDAYAVQGTYNGQTLFEAHVTELGNVIDAKSILGWNLQME